MKDSNHRIIEVTGTTATIRRAITASDLDAEGHVTGTRCDNGDGTLDETFELSELPDDLYALAMAMQPRVPCQCGDGSCMLCDDNGMVPAEVSPCAA